VRSIEQHSRKRSVATGALLWAVLASCREAPPLVAPNSFPVASPTQAAEAYEREYVAEIQAVQHVELRARMKGFIEALAVDEGQAVKKGQPLFSISAREVQQELQKAQAATAGALAELASAQLERTNTKLLFEKKVVSDVELAVSESKVRSLRAKLDQAKAEEGQAAINLSYAQVRAPFDGIVNRIPKKTGSIVAEGDLLTTIANTNEMLVYFRLSEREFLEYSATSDEDRPKEVRLKLASGEVYPIPGRIDAVESEFDKATGNIALRARFPNEKHDLKHGSSGKIVVSIRVRDALMVPQRSTFEIQEHVYLYVLDQNDIAHARRIEPRLRLKDAFVVNAGLTAQDRFVLEGVQRIKDGERIVVRPESLRRDSPR
jgi:membrane fusion protein, multidrug efflux system